MTTTSPATSEPAGLDLLTRQEAEKVARISRSQLYEEMAQGDFPRPVHLTARKRVWLRNEVEAWVRRRIAARDARAA